MRIIATGKNEKICTHCKALFINEPLLLSSVLIGSKQIVVKNGLQGSSPEPEIEIFYVIEPTGPFHAI